jgi:hypothetical protein
MMKREHDVYNIFIKELVLYGTVSVLQPCSSTIHASSGIYTTRKNKL